jgi:hypothetical protein
MKREKQWLEKNKYYSKLAESKLTSIFYFPLIWNLFEKTCCAGNAQINIHAPELANDYADKIKEMSPIWAHFQTRYVQDEKTTSVFDLFEFKPGDKKDTVKTILLADSKSSNKEKMEALLRIAFRLRNNLFHGEKDVSKLYEQNENFKQINILLMALMDANGS